MNAHLVIFEAGGEYYASLYLGEKAYPVFENDFVVEGNIDLLDYE
jgi:hypothetical protein